MGRYRRGDKSKVQLGVQVEIETAAGVISKVPASRMVQCFKCRDSMLAKGWQEHFRACDGRPRPRPAKARPSPEGPDVMDLPRGLLYRGGFRKG